MKKIITVLSVLMACGAGSLAYAQEETEIGKLKQRLMALEQKIYSNSSQKSATSGTLMADFQARLSNLEDEAQKVYGAVEELGFTVNEFAKKMDLISKDIDLRLTDLETSMAEIKAAQKVVKLEPNTADKKPQKPQSKKAEPKASHAASAVQSNVPSDLTAEDLYSKAYHFLVATSYDQSEEWMKEFIKRHPSHDLADNAHYWLGEIYLVKEMPEKAVVSFSTGLSKFPKGAKAPANLLKMGTAFKQMGKNDFAQSSWKKLIKDFEKSPEADKATKELEALKAAG
ncbi:MAG: tol-pal system protein YbgF [Magnetococcales bacterium]|nr:tol-pal system protein YbgF [Magnetococcales bacterium]|tara:strand:- start:19478 stop:20332 length:855 start_codon:yes stop_codon:yes gene_type:complete